MRAARLERHGGPEVLEVVTDHREPVPGPSDALVEVRACGLNRLDIWVRKGGRRPVPLPLIPGTDGAGVVLEAPPGSGLEPGDEVVIYPAEGCGICEACGRGDDPLCPSFRIFGAARDGMLAERVAVPARNCLPKPAGLSFVDAASVPVNWITAWHMLVERARLAPGETILIQAAGSGVSSAGIQIARLLGARVIATSSTPEKLEHARALGADATIDYRREDVAARALELTDGRGVDVVFDHVGEPNFGVDIASLAKGGRLVTCGTTGGGAVSLDLSAFYFKSQSILGSTLGRRDELRTILELIALGRLRTTVDRVYPLEQLAEAHRFLEEGRQKGKVVIEV